MQGFYVCSSVIVSSIAPAIIPYGGAFIPITLWHSKFLSVPLVGFTHPVVHFALVLIAGMLPASLAQKLIVRCIHLDLLRLPCLQVLPLACEHYMNVGVVRVVMMYSK